MDDETAPLQAMGPVAFLGALDATLNSTRVQTTWDYKTTALATTAHLFCDRKFRKPPKPEEFVAMASAIEGFLKDGSSG